MSLENLIYSGVRPVFYMLLLSGEVTEIY